MKQLIGLDETATPNDAFSRITLGNKRYGVNLYVKYQDETPASGITITSSGSLPIDGSMVTDENGYLFLAQDSTSFTASIDNADGKLYIDLEENPSVSATLSQTITTVSLIWNFNENAIKIDSSKTVTFSNSVKTFDVCAVGGGGGGASAANKYNPLPANYNAPGGQPFGATGACSIYNMSDGSTQKAGAGNPSGPGGGGGGEANGGGSGGADASNGNKGVVYLRFHH